MLLRGDQQPEPSAGKRRETSCEIRHSGIGWHPVELACKWFGHDRGPDFLGVRYTTSGDGDGDLSFYIGSKCLRCGYLQEVDVVGLEPFVFSKTWMRKEFEFWKRHFETDIEQAAEQDGGPVISARRDPDPDQDLF